ncbi:histone deacetylase [Alphaproteobacteria bacterium]|nr:histone deacetylase [Alphaproteobacteria bacterium]
MPSLVFHPNYDIPLPDGHRFPATKFSRLIANLDKTGLLDRFDIHQPEPVMARDLAITQHPDYIDAIANGTLAAKQIRVLGLNWSEVLARRSFLAVNGTLLAARHALLTGLACHAAGGTHHAHYDYGAGFCVFNDLAYAATSLCNEGAVKSVLIIDCDVHQGDGTARILENDDRVFTCSMHCRTNYPARKATSNLDVEIEKGTSDDGYITIVRDTLAHLDETGVRPDLVLYDAGVDVHANDRLGYLEMTNDGIMTRDKAIIGHFRERDIPVATVIGGGYGTDQDEVAARHRIVFSAALAFA